MVRPTARPWRVKRSDASIWIEGPQGSAPGKHPRQRRIVCEFKLYGDEALDAETEANLDLIVQRVNGE